MLLVESSYLLRKMMSNDAPPRLPSVETNSFSLSKSTNQSTYKCLRRVYDWHQRGIQLSWDTCKANTIEVSLSAWGLLPDGDLLSGEETSRDTEVNFDFIRCSKLKNKLRIIQFNGRTRLCRPFNRRI